jgi:hypothetical protein
MKNTSVTHTIVSVLLQIYGLISSIFAFYFNYSYARENGFIEWLFFGELIALCKAILWPFFVL